MTFFEFTELSEHKQYDLLFTSGEFVDSTEKGNANYVLYKLYTFYVEVVYDSQTNIIKGISSFLSAKQY